MNVEVWRGAVVESRHQVSVAVVDAGGALVARAGDAERRTFVRSSVKVLQALPLVEDGAADALGLTEQELALACASHSGEPFHVEAVQSMLRKAGLGPDHLACGAARPMSGAARQALRASGEAWGRVHNECSGKHAGMLALAAHHGWPVEGYQRADHPVQQRMLREVSRWTGVPQREIGTAVDGCAVVTFALPLSRLAAAYARFAAAARSDGSAEARLAGAMLRHPEYVGGTERLCTELMRAGSGRLLAKIGAEGVYCAADLRSGLGVALKVEDGARRASEPAIVAVLDALNVIEPDVLERLGTFVRPPIHNTRGDVVGHIEVHAALEYA